MPIVDRPEFPRKHKLNFVMLLLAIVALIFGLYITKYNNKARLERIVIHSVSFDEYDRSFIRLGYEIENKGKNTEVATLLASVIDEKGGEIASIMFPAEIKAHSVEYQTKMIDKLDRPLKEGEKPYKATIEVYKRRFWAPSPH